MTDEEIAKIATKLNENQIEMIHTLAYCRENGSYSMRGAGPNNPDGGYSVLDCGGSNGSHHSGTLTRLAERGLIDHRKRGYEWGECPKHYRGSKEYRANDITLRLAAYLKEQRR